MEGFATKEGTERFRKRHEVPEQAYRRLGRTELTTSTLGFGCYRVDAPHRPALEKALRMGCNLIDTSTNYTDGGSETTVGLALADLEEKGIVRRDEIIVVSKVGYVQGHNLEYAQQRESSGKPFPDMVKYTEGCWHCLHPEFIEDQLTRSLDRLQLDRLDIYLLHNPEYFFSDAQKRKDRRTIEELREDFYDRIKRAFECLEDQVAKGRIQAYGISSNTFGAPIHDTEGTSLTRCWEIAESVSQKRGEKHHFSVVQMPANLFESGPVREANNGPDDTQTALEFAHDKDLAVLINRPLNAFFDNQLVRLATFAVPLTDEDPKSLLLKVGAMEEDFAENLAPLIKTTAESADADEFFRWGRELSELPLKSLAVEHWTQLETQVIKPQLEYLTEQLNNYFHGELSATWIAWRDKYHTEMAKLLPAIRYRCASQSQRMSTAVSERLERWLPESIRKESLSRKALQILTLTPGVTCVLNGMRKPEYVDDALGIWKMPSWEVKKELYEDFQE